MSARRPRPSRLREDRGSATAETAIVLPVVVTMVLVILVGAVALGAQIRLESAARGAARELARGEDVATASAVARRIGGPGTTVDISADGDWVRVGTRRELRIDAPLLGGARFALTADAEARLEPSLTATGPTTGRSP